jgi:hypothetical protein
MSPGANRQRSILICHRRPTAGIQSMTRTLLIAGFSAILGAMVPPHTHANLMAQAPDGPGRGVRKVETPHLVLTTSSTDQAAAPGTRISLLLDIAPKPKMHVYAPEQKELIPISLSLTPDEAIKVHPAKFPKSEKYFFAPLNETQFVYSRPFRIVQDVTLAPTPAVRERASAPGATLTISGTLRYQACDDKVCYMPQNLPVSWTVSLRPLER